jgi:catechol 2,3-dioxygenase-like lactoylglutathione lyase family enzyme
VFERVTVRVPKLAAAEAVYRTLLRTLEIADWPDFALEESPAPTRGLHIAFVAPSRAHVDAFWRAGLDAGLRDDGEPGPRPEYSDSYYGGFLRDPDDNSIEAIHHDAVRRDGIVDHLWIRVADLEASRRFYEELAPRAGFQLRAMTDAQVRHGVALPARARFAGAVASFSVVADTPVTENLQLAFASAEAAELRDPDGNTIVLG